MEGNEGGILSQDPDWKPFLLKIKMKQSPGCPNKEVMQSLSTSE